MVSLIGNGPLLRLEWQFPGGELHGKAEWAHPGGPVKDRPALNIVLEAERSGALAKNKMLIDSTSGNSGIACAMICAARGHRGKAWLSTTASVERKRILKAYGAELVFTDRMEGAGGAIRGVRRAAAEHPDVWFCANQYDNRPTGALITTPPERRFANRAKVV